MQLTVACRYAQGKDAQRLHREPGAEQTAYVGRLVAKKFEGGVIYPGQVVSVRWHWHTEDSMFLFWIRC